MADFNVYPALQLQNPDILGGYLKGGLGAQQLQMGQMDVAAKRLAMPYLPQQLAQEAEHRGLSLEQLRNALQIQHAWMGMAGLGDETTGEGGQSDTGQGAPALGRTEGISNGPQAGMSPHMRATMSMLGQDPEQLAALTAAGGGNYFEAATQAQNLAVKTAQIQALQPGQPLPILRAFAGMERPSAALAQPQNAALLAAYPELARKYGYSPLDTSDATIRQVATLAANDIERPRLMEPTKTPERLITGAGGSQWGSISGKRVSEPDFATLSPQEYKTTDLDESSPTYGQQVSRIKLVQTKPGLGGPPPGAGGAGPGGGLPSGVAATALGLRGGGGGAAPRAPAAARTSASPAKSSDITLGAEGFKPEEAKLAGIALRMRDPLGKLNQFENEAGGPVLDENQRTLVVSGLTKEADGLANLLPAAIKQHVLSWGLSGKAADYVANLIPFIQGAAEQMPKTSLRGVDAPNLLAALESMIPRSKDDLASAQANRRNAFQGMVIASGNAAHQLYRNTLGVDRQIALSGGQAVHMNGQTYVKKPDGSIVRIVP